MHHFEWGFVSYLFAWRNASLPIGLQYLRVARCCKLGHWTILCSTFTVVRAAAQIYVLKIFVECTTSVARVYCRSHARSPTGSRSLWFCKKCGSTKKIAATIYFECIHAHLYLVKSSPMIDAIVLISNLIVVCEGGSPVT